MIFNSYTFLFVFLPLTLLVFSLLRRFVPRAAFAWLVLASIAFYGVWNPDPAHGWSPKYILLILGSCGGNYLIGRFLTTHRDTHQGKVALVAGLTANLGLLGYYKYAGFFAGITAKLIGWPATPPSIILPLAISFFTFLQIAYLVDAWRGQTKEYKFTDYLLFVTFFPHLIAGPLVHHKEMMPQFKRKPGRTRFWVNFAVGLAILIIGLFKKVVIADNLSPIANNIFDLAASGERPVTTAEAWVGAISYGLQLYFDFSGYSDMALGAARLFGIRFPLNFHSPYKADSVVDFWRRWHMTLSRFLRDYLYIPLGGNRKGPARRYINLFLTMLLGGLWHGAGWTFVIWGALHGIYLCLNHAWFGFRKKMGWKPMPRPIAILLTFVAVLVSWVPFRAGAYELVKNGGEKAMAATGQMYRAMLGMNGIHGWPDSSAYVVKDAHAVRACMILLIVWLLPNTQQFLRRYNPALDPSRVMDGRPGTRRWWEFRPNAVWAFGLVLLLAGVLYQFDKLSEFIYFQF
ncbi:MBOAT family O-acyltransferase [Luteolibacter soli]|uniref:MBOAT family protein n=1 Tax=Luteolibacter soli TaxID=3135280 RepID=A0ABU9AYX0_9BACT